MPVEPPYRHVARLVIANLSDDAGFKQEQVRAVYDDVDASEDPDEARALITVSAVEMLTGYLVELYGGKEEVAAAMRSGILHAEAEDP